MPAPLPAPLLVFLGAGLGGIARWALSSALQRLVDTPFPLGTLAVNVLGCAAIGLLVGAASGADGGLRESHRLFLVIGVLGGFTTFSTFAFDSAGLAIDRRFALAALNVILSNLLGLAAAWTALRLTAARA